MVNIKMEKAFSNIAALTIHPWQAPVFTLDSTEKALIFETVVKLL